MPIEFENVDVITYDSFTTLVDVHSSTRQILSKYVDEPNKVAEVWRFRAVEYRMLSNFISHYEPYLETTRQALGYSLLRNDEKLSDRFISEIV